MQCPKKNRKPGNVKPKEYFQLNCPEISKREKRARSPFAAQKTGEFHFKYLI